MPTVLFSMLDWGLGHTSRSIPLLRLLEAKGYKILVACNSSQKVYLTREKLHCEWLELEGYGIRYGRTGWLTTLFLFFQIPRIWGRMRQEKKLLNRWIKEFKPRFVVSDNRYGFYSEEVPTYFVTHQLNLQTGLGGLINSIANFFLYQQLQPNYLILVPDLSDKPGLAGTLSHPKIRPEPPLHFIGPLSRFSGSGSRRTPNGSLLILLSGPEPMRSLLEKKLRAQLNGIAKKVILVRGLTDLEDKPIIENNLTIFNHLSSEHLLHYLNSASIVISRSGYSSLMDYVCLGIHPILIPTPGQGEQQYLGRHFNQMKWGLSFPQQNFVLEAALQAHAKAVFRPFPQISPSQGEFFDRFAPVSE